jgi:hypothetical protein
MIGVIIMNRNEFIELFFNNKVISLEDCLDYHYEFERPVSEMIEELMRISDISIDRWIDMVLLRFESLKEFYEETKGFSHDSLFFTEGVLLEELRDRVCDVVDLFEGYGIMETDPSTQKPVSSGTDLAKMST